MKKGMGPLPKIDAHTEQIFRFAGLLLPVVLFLYGILIQLNGTAAAHPISLPALYVICSLFVVFSVYQYLSPITTFRAIALRLVIYHVLSIIYILFVSGFNSPFTSFLIILFLASHLCFGRIGLSVSIVAFLLTLIADIAIYGGNIHYIIGSVLFFISTTLVGYVIGTISAYQEIDRKELSRSQAEETLQHDRIITIVNNLADAVLSTDKNGVIQLYNAASLNLLDTNSELRGKTIDQLIKLHDRDEKPFRFARNFKTLRSVESREDLSATISGETIHLSVIYSPIRSTNSNEEVGNDGYVVILRDITKQKSLEEERDEFISVVSHELRTPITITEGSLSNVLVMMNRPEIPKTTLLETVKASHEQVLFLAKMVNDLSTLSRAERGVADTPEDINVSELVHDLFREYAPQAETKGLRFNLDLPPTLGTVSASRLYLKELLQNFITNAIKYTKEGEVAVTVKQVDGTMSFAVKDSGIGISKSDQLHIFERFWRSEDYRTRETGGTGLGLYVARKLAKKLGTRIELTSRLNHGSTFSFTLPITK